MEPESALLVIDVQVDFCPGGRLPVPEGDAVVPILNAYASRFAAAGRPIIATRDWHPARTRHFREYGGTWPPHCIQGTPGAAFHPDLQLPEGTVVVSKGMDPEQDSYSGFDAIAATGQPLEELLHQLGVQYLYVGGLATDYCVKATVLDARERHFAVTLLTDAIRGVEVAPGDSARALAAMIQAGAQPATLAEVVPWPPGFA